MALKSLVLTLENGTILDGLHADTVEPDCGVVRFVPPTGLTTFYLYYLPHHQSGGGAGLHFHWFNCTGTTKASGCVTVANSAPDRTARSACCAVMRPARLRLILECFVARLVCCNAGHGR